MTEIDGDYDNRAYMPILIMGIWWQPVPQFYSDWLQGLGLGLLGIMSMYIYFISAYIWINCAATVFPKWELVLE